jgi:hypothetical protein
LIPPFEDNDLLLSGLESNVVNDENIACLGMKIASTFCYQVALGGIEVTIPDLLAGHT